MKKNKIVFILMFFTSVCVQAQKKPALTETQKLAFDNFFFGGMREKMINNNEAAEDLFRKALNLDQNNANTHFQLASVLLKNKKEAEAEKEAQTAYTLDPANEWYGKLLLDIYKHQRKYASAEKILKAQYKQSGDHDLLFEIAMIQMMNDDNKAALKSFDQLEKLTGVTEQITREKEQIYLTQNKLQKAIDEVTKLIKAHPEVASYKGILADLYLANGKGAQALALYQEILKQEPTNGFASFAIADYYRDRKESDSCFKYLSDGLKGQVDNKTKLAMLAELIPTNHFGSDHTKKCQMLTDTFIRFNPSEPAGFLIKGDLNLQERNLDSARAAYLIASKMNGGSLSAWEQVLQCDQLMSRYDLMAADCEQIIDVFPSYPNAYLFKSIAHMQLKQYPAAITACRYGLEVADDPEFRSQLLSNLGDAAQYNKQHQLSDSSYDAALLIKPDNAYALNNYAYYLSLRLEHLDKADSMSKKSIELDPKNASYQDTYGWILYQKKDYSNARIYIEKSLEMSPNNAEVREHYGDVLSRLNLNEESLVQWKKAKELGSLSETLDLKIKTKSIPSGQK